MWCICDLSMWLWGVIVCALYCWLIVLGRGILQCIHSPVEGLWFLVFGSYEWSHHKHSLTGVYVNLSFHFSWVNTQDYIFNFIKNCQNSYFQSNKVRFLKITVFHSNLHSHLQHMRVSLTSHLLQLLLSGFVCLFRCTGQSFIFEYVLNIFKNQFG